MQDIYKNLGGFLRIDDHDVKFQRLQFIDHPYYLPKFDNAINFSLPLVADDVLKVLVGVFNVESDGFDNSSQKKALSEASDNNKFTSEQKSMMVRNALREKLQSLELDVVVVYSEETT